MLVSYSELFYDSMPQMGMGYFRAISYLETITPVVLVSTCKGWERSEDILGW